MPNRAEIITPTPPKGRPADRLAAGIALVGLIAACAATLWFFLGFYETDPNYAAASAAFLLALGLGAFAIIPSAIILRLCWTSWRKGFRVAYGAWTLFFISPWIGLALLALRSDWLSLWLSLVPLLIGIPLGLWALISLFLEVRNR